jgi:hypothetical protein
VNAEIVHDGGRNYYVLSRMLRSIVLAAPAIFPGVSTLPSQETLPNRLYNTYLYDIGGQDSAREMLRLGFGGTSNPYEPDT